MRRIAGWMVLVLAGCECGFLPVDELTDAGSADAGHVQDAGTPDSGTSPRDAGPGLDAAVRSDAGMPFDAGEAPDAGRPVDAGQSVDAGRPVDAGQSVDAGQPVDAGQLADAGPGASAIELPARLPMGLHEATAVAFEDAIWIFGGRTQNVTFNDVVLRFDPETETITSTTYRMPFGRQASSGVRVGGFIYLFGGTASGLLSEILRFDPVTGAFTRMNASLPTGRYNHTAVAAGTIVYVFGGFDYSYQRQILRYDTQGDVLTVLPAAFPAGREYPATVTIGDQVFVMGGHANNQFFSDVFRFDTTSELLINQSFSMPARIWAPAPFQIDGLLYLYSGEHTTSVTRFEPAAQRFSVVSGPVLPRPQMGRASAAALGRGYVFGGLMTSGQVLDTIIRFTP